MQNIRATLAQLKAQNRYRALHLPAGVDFTSNDYLGMASHPALRSAAITALQNGMDIGAAGSRLLRGHTNAHENLETFAATHFAAPRTLFFASGFQANYALLTTLPSRQDVIMYDSLIHASMRDGIHATSARSHKFPHNNLSALEDSLKKYAGQTIWIAIESLYSMDGDTAPIDEIYALAEKYNAYLLIDEAHSTGIYGEQGKGLCWPLIQKHGYARLVTLHTCGKALGVAGGLVCANENIIDLLINRARGFIYSTAPMPLQAFLVQQSLEIIAGPEGDARRAKLYALCAVGQNLFGGSGTPIIPIILGTEERALKVAAGLQSQGFDIRAIRPPTVAEGSARLRLSLSNALDPAILQTLADALEEFQEDHPS